MLPLLPSGPVAAPSTVLTMLTRSHGAVGRGVQLVQVCSSPSVACETARQDPHTHRITQYCTPNGVVVVVDLGRPGVGHGPAELDDRRDRGEQLAGQRLVHLEPPAPAAEPRARHRTPRPARRSGPGAFSVRRALPFPTTRYACLAVVEPRPRGRACRNHRNLEQVLGHPHPLRIGQHRHLGPEPADRLQTRGPQLGDRVLDPGVLRQQREHAGHEHDARHCSPRIARRGSRRPAMVLTMSTVCRVSTTSWTR